MPGVKTEMSLQDVGAWAGRQADQLQRLDWSAYFRRASVLLASAARMTFDSGTDPDGVPWAALQHPSARRGGLSARPLRDRDILMASMTGGANHVETITATELVQGTSVFYAGFHQDSTRYIPRRAFLGFSATTIDRLDRMAAEFWDEQVTK